MKSDPIAQEHPANCLNCGGAVHASFCPWCGQETALHVPSAREFLHEFVGHYVALEGKLWKSLGLLLFKPGRLTRDYIEGRRERYVLPLRLYLTFSILFFAVFKFGGYDFEGRTDDGKARAEIQAENRQDFERSSDIRQLNLDKLKQNQELNGKLAGIPRTLAQKAEKLNGMSYEEVTHRATAAFFSYAPYVVFAMMPVFALYLKLLYLGSGRRYGEHLLFALHTNAFAFLMLGLLMLTPSGIPVLGEVLGLWLVFYLPIAMRKVYGGARLATFVRWIVLMALHLLGMFLAIMGTVAIGALAA